MGHFFPSPRGTLGTLAGISNPTNEGIAENTKDHHTRYAFFFTRNLAMTCYGASQFFLCPVMRFGDALRRHAVSAGKHDYIPITCLLIRILLHVCSLQKPFTDNYITS